MKRRSGFTLVELLTTVAIVGILIGLLLPAIQSARESARRTSCANNVKQLALGCLGYEESQGHFPSGGWAWQWTGDADAGLGPKQPGGWAYQILPFIEQNPTFMMGSDGALPPASASTTQRNAARDRCAVPIPSFVCPSRRGVGALACLTFNTSQNSAAINVSAGLDYAGNTGANSPSGAWGGNNSWTYNDYVPRMASGVMKQTGVIFPCSSITAASIRDGLTLTVLLGEFNRHPEDYGTTISNPYGGVSWSTSLAGLSADAQNTPGVYWNQTNYRPFGSAHTGGCSFAFCDGSVRTVRYDISQTLMGDLCHRSDRAPLNLEDL